jgi:predicted Zn-dependent peptidase
VFETRIATEIAASQNSRELGSFFQVVATAAPGHTLADLERAITAEIGAFTQSGPTAAEMERCRAQAETQLVYRLQTVGGFGGKGDQLNAYNVFLGDPGFFDRDLARYRGATAASLQAAAADWLSPQTRVTLSVVPRGRTASALDGSGPVAVS